MRFFNFIKRHPIKMSFVLVFFLVITSFTLRVKTGKAIIPFGGPILEVIPCPCSGNLVVIIGPPVGGVFTLDETATIDMFYQIFRPGPWALGNYIPGSVGCWWIFPDGCFPVYGPIGTINEVGTSM